MLKEKIETEKINEEPILKIIVGRHGPKLSAAGEKNALAAYFKDSVISGYNKMDIEDADLIHLATSPVTRAVDTANIHRDTLLERRKNVKNVVTKKKSLEVPFQPKGEVASERFSDDLDTILKMQKKLEPEIRREVEASASGLDTESKEAEIRNQIDMKVLQAMFADAENKEEEERTFITSYEELADLFARRYLGFIEHTNLLGKLQKGGDRKRSYIQIDISHSFPITAFLKKYLIFSDGKKASQLSSEEFFSRTDGIIRESGSFEMKIINNKTIEVQGEFSPGKKFAGNIDINKLEELKLYEK